MYSKVYKNHQINIGAPILVKIPYDERFVQDYGAAQIGGVLYGETRIDHALYDDDAPFRETPIRVAADSGLDSGSNSGFFADADADADYGSDSDADHGSDADSGINSGFEPGSDLGGYSEADIISSAEAEAESIIKAARAEGADIVAGASKEANRIIEAAMREAKLYVEKMSDRAEEEAAAIRERAVLDGEREGRIEGRAEYDMLIEEAERVRAEANEEYKKLILGAERDVLELVLSVTKKVVGEEFKLNRENLILMIKDALERCTNREDVVIKISSGDYDFVAANRELLLSMVEGIDKLDIRRDLSLESDSCVIETPFGSLDAGASTRLLKIEDAFYKILSANRPEDDGMIA